MMYVNGQSGAECRISLLCGSVRAAVIRNIRVRACRRGFLRLVFLDEHHRDHDARDQDHARDGHEDLDQQQAPAIRITPAMGTRILTSSRSSVGSV